MTVEEIFEKCQKITNGKRQDYTTGPNRNENFHRSAMIISWFANDRDRPYAALIGTKMARLGSLLSKESKPNFESIEDNFADIINYFALWLEDLTESKSNPALRDLPHKFKSQGEHPFCDICGLHSSSHSIKENYASDPIADSIRQTQK